VPLLLLFAGGGSLNQTILVVVFLIFSVSVHEAAHGWVALKCGDTTARDLGRITVNPLVHIDPFMSILLPAVLFMTTGMAFGGAKPVPVIFHNLRHPYRDMALVAIAGPLSNVLLALVFGFLFRFVVEWSPVGYAEALPDALHAAIVLNLLLAVFNLIPIPPLDGSRVLAWLLPSEMREPYAVLERFGLFIIFGLLFTGILNDPLIAGMNSIWQVLRPIVYLGAG
jgi:Zn-dependent protease